MEVKIKDERKCRCGKTKDIYERKPAADEKAVLKDCGELEETETLKFCGNCHGCLHPQIAAAEALHDIENRADQIDPSKGIDEEKLRKETNEEYKKQLKTDPSLKERIEEWEFGPTFKEELENYGLTLSDVEFEVEEQ